jgi:hypothetical protein
MECAHRVEAVALYTVDRVNRFVTERISRELVEAARRPVVVVGIRFEQGRPSLPVTVLQSLDGGFDGGVGKHIRER